MNPWSENESGVPPAESSTKSFEDDFLTPDPCQNAPEKLPDSEEYLGKLERKLHRLQNNTNVLQQLRDRREHCIEALLASDGPLEQRISDLELDQPASENQFLRIINPNQPLTVGEVLHLVKHDELDQSADEEHKETLEETQSTSSSASR